MNESSSSTNMNILFVGSNYHANQNPAIKSLLDRGHNVQYLIQSNHPSEPTDVVTPIKYPWSKVYYLIEFFLWPIFFIQMIFTGNCSCDRKKYSWPSLLFLIHKFRSFDPDLIIMRNNPSFGFRMYFVVTSIVARAFDVPRITYNQERLLEVKEDSGLRRFARRYGILPNVAFTPASGDFSEKKPDKVELPTLTVYHVPLVIEPSRYNRLKKYKQDGIIRILVIGTYSSQYKRHELCLEAASKISIKHSIELTFVGHGNKSSQRFQYLNDLANHLGVDDITRFKLNIPHYEMNKRIYRHHDLFILPSRRESYGFSVLEAAANGLPVMASNKNGSSDCIYEGKNGHVFESDSLLDLINAIEFIIGNTDRLENFGNESKRIIEQKHAPQSYSKQIEAIYQEHFDR